MVRLNNNIAISDADIVYKFSRSGGPGGQNVNKLNTRVTLLFDIARCRGLTEEQRHRILTRLTSRISSEGLLTVVSQRHRTQQANRKAAQERLAALLTDALKVIPVRKQTAVPHAEKQKRLKRKRRRSEIKQQRKSVALQ
jgi:ribosome-associated protein